MTIKPFIQIINDETNLRELIARFHIVAARELPDVDVGTADGAQQPTCCVELELSTGRKVIANFDGDEGYDVIQYLLIGREY